MEILLKAMTIYIQMMFYENFKIFLIVNNKTQCFNDKMLINKTKTFRNEGFFMQ